MPLLPKHRKKQGQSRETFWKELGIRDALAMSLRLSFGTNGKLSTYPFWYIDLNSGYGRNTEAKCDGSPIEFLKAASKARRYYRAFFCDKKKEFIPILERRIESLQQLGSSISTRQCIRQDNKLLLPQIAGLIQSCENPRFAVGCVLSDPNGPSPARGFPLKEIVKFCQQFPRLDVVLNINVSSLVRCRGLYRSKNLWKKDPDGERCRKWKTAYKKWPAHSLRGMMKLLPKKYWLVREPSGADMRYVLLVGRNMPVGAHVALGFHTAKSAEGKEIIRNADK